jgi:PadR family transcriptional regulator, regulatory protein PadR
MKFSDELVRGSVGRIVLSLLRERALYAYEIIQLVHGRTRGAVDWTEGALYPALHKLEQGGFVSAKWRIIETARGGERRRKYYALTPRGRRELSRRVQEWREFCFAVNMLLPDAAKQLPT